MKVGVQMYTLRDYCKDLQSFSETLKRISEMGFSTVQVSGTCAYEAEWLRDRLKENGLTCDLTHYNYDRIVGDTEAVIAEHKTFGCKYIGVGSLPGIFSGEKDKIPQYCADFVAKAKPAAKKIAESGCYFMYHNHAAEYENSIDGKNCMEYLSDNFGSDEMGFTLDTYWVKCGGYDPVEWFKKLSGRIPCVHYKDLVTMPDGTKRFAPVGSGELDFDAIIKTSLDLGVEFAFVEQDNCYGEDPFMCLKKSYDYLKSMGLN